MQDDARLLALAPGLYGEISVWENGVARWLSIGQERQGSAVSTPDCCDLAAGLTAGPGPIPGDPYCLSWLVPACRNPQGRCLMFGLGAGIGAVMMLYNFPYLTITVVESDPVVLSLAKKWFPLVGHYIREGRLEVILGDGAAVVDTVNRRFDFAVVDAYQGENEMVFVRPEFYRSLKLRADEIWINYIGVIGEAGMAKLLATLNAEQVAPAVVMTPQFITNINSFDPDGSYNWLIGNRAPEPALLESFTPYAELTEPAQILDVIRRSYKLLVAQLPYQELLQAPMALLQNLR